MLISYWLYVISLAFLCLFSLTSAFAGGECIPFDKESPRRFETDPAFFFSGVLRDLVYNYLH